MATAARLPRIAYVCADRGVPVFGQKGCSIHVQEMLHALLQRGAHVELFATSNGGVAPAGLEPVAVSPLPPPPKGDRAAREQASLGANAALRAALEDAGPFDLVYERYSLWSFAAMEYARAAGIPGVLEVNAPLIQEQEEHRGLIDRAAAECVAERVFGAARALIAVSDGVAAYLDSFPAARGRVHVVPNGVDVARFTPDVRPSHPAPPRTFTVGFVGSLKPWHGLPVLAQAFDVVRRAAPDSRLLVVGDGPERAALSAELASRGALDAVEFTGAVAPEEVPALLTSMDVAAAPYPDLENFYFSPLKVYEYMAAGRAVVASALGQLTDLIRHRVNGLLTPPGDPAALASALDLLRRDAHLRRRLGSAARETVLREHTWESVARRILTLAGLERESAPAAARHAGRAA